MPALGGFGGLEGPWRDIGRAKSAPHGFWFDENPKPWLPQLLTASWSLGSAGTTLHGNPELVLPITEAGMEPREGEGGDQEVCTASGAQMTLGKSLSPCEHSELAISQLPGQRLEPEYQVQILPPPCPFQAAVEAGFYPLWASVFSPAKWGCCENEGR